MFRLALLSWCLHRLGRGEENNAFLHQIGKKHVLGNQLSGAGGASASFVRKILQIFIDMASCHLMCSSGGQIILREPGDKLLNLCAIRMTSQRALVQLTRNLV